MRAAVLTDWRQLEIRDVPEPDCPVDGVVVELLACGICRSDWHGWVGADPNVKPPHIPGHEFCGTVRAVGADVRDWAIGDRVIAPFILACGRCDDCRSGHQTICATQKVPGFTIPGAFAERIAVPRADHNLAPLPEGMSPTLAAALGCRVTTVWHALTDRAALAPGEWLAVHGVGGIGLAAVLLGRAMGARVLAVDVVAEKLALAGELGAIPVPAEGAAERIREITGDGAHVSVEALGIGVTTEASIRCLRRHGRHVQIGKPTGEHARMSLPMDAVYAGQLALYGTRGMPAWKYPSLFAMIENGLDLGPMVAREVPLSAAQAELETFDGPTPPGVAVITDFTA